MSWRRVNFKDEKILHAHVNIWGVILAGGEGRRLQSYVHSLYNDMRPKQFATLVGDKSMLQLTLDRVKKIIPSERIFIAVTNNHMPYVEDQLGKQPLERIVIQPFCRETAPGILLSLLHIFKRDQHARVVLFPSDHFILEEERFMMYVKHAASFVRSHQKYIVLLGMVPQNSTSDYGWVVRGKELARYDTKVIYSVNGFYEKPCPAVAAELQSKGGLWNTLILVGNVAMMIDQFRMLTP